ncbi:MAG: hypothetical protein ABL861_00260 [Nitrosomonas sp.]
MAGLEGYLQPIIPPPLQPIIPHTATTRHAPASLQLVISAHIPRHPREGGDPEPPNALPPLDSRLRGNDEKKIDDGNDGEKSGCFNRWRFPVAAGC